MNVYENKVTIPRYFKSFFKNFLAAYKGKQLIVTIISGVISLVLGTLFTAYVFPHMFAASGFVNQLYAGLATSLCVMGIIGLVIGAVKGKKKYFNNFVQGGVLLFRGYFAKSTKLSNRLWVIATTACGALFGCLFSAPFKIILAVWIALEAFQPNGNLLVIVAAVQNSFNNAFRKNHTRIPENTRRDALGLALGMLLAAIVCAIIRGITG